MSYAVEGLTSFQNSYGSANALDTFFGQTGGYTEQQIQGTQGLGSIGDFISGNAAGIALALAAVFFLRTSPVRKEKKSKMAAARQRYRDEMKSIKDEYGFMGTRKFKFSD